MLENSGDGGPAPPEEGGGAPHWITLKPMGGRNGVATGFRGRGPTASGGGEGPEGEGERGVWIP